MLDSAEAVRISAAVAVVIGSLGLIIAWLPALRHGAAATLPIRMLVAAGLLTISFDLGGLGTVLGFALAGMGIAAMWQSQPEPEVPRPRRKGVILASVATGLVVLASLQGWWLLGRVPEEAQPVAALVLGAVGMLSTLAIADRSRVQEREAIRYRLLRPNMAPASAGGAATTDA